MDKKDASGGFGFSPPNSNLDLGSESIFYFGDGGNSESQDDSQKESKNETIDAEPSGGSEEVANFGNFGFNSPPPEEKDPNKKKDEKTERTMENGSGWGQFGAVRRRRKVKTKKKASEWGFDFTSPNVEGSEDPTVENSQHFGNVGYEESFNRFFENNNGEKVEDLPDMMTTSPLPEYTNCENKNEDLAEGIELKIQSRETQGEKNETEGTNESPRMETIDVTPQIEESSETPNVAISDTEKATGSDDSDIPALFDSDSDIEGDNQGSEENNEDEQQNQPPRIVEGPNISPRLENTDSSENNGMDEIENDSSDDDFLNPSSSRNSRVRNSVPRMENSDAGEVKSVPDPPPLIDSSSEEEDIEEPRRGTPVEPIPPLMDGSSEEENVEEPQTDPPVESVPNETTVLMPTLVEGLSDSDDDEPLPPPLYDTDDPDDSYHPPPLTTDTESDTGEDDSESDVPSLYQSDCSDEDSDTPGPNEIPGLVDTSDEEEEDDDDIPPPGLLSDSSSSDDDSDAEGETVRNVPPPATRTEERIPNNNDGLMGLNRGFLLGDNVNIVSPNEEQRMEDNNYDGDDEDNVGIFDGHTNNLIRTYRRGTSDHQRTIIESFGKRDRIRSDKSRMDKPPKVLPTKKCFLLNLKVDKGTQTHYCKDLAMIRVFFIMNVLLFAYALERRFLE